MTVKTDPHDIQEDPMTSASQHAQPSQTGEQTQGLRLRQVAQALDAAVLTGEDHLDIVVQSACCSDLMSDVLAFVHEKAIVLTGLANAHVILHSGDATGFKVHRLCARETAAAGRN